MEILVSRMKIHLKDFALTGHFGPVKIGMKKDNVLEILGNPDHEEAFSTGSTVILYGSYEFYFDTESATLTAIQNDHLQAIDFNNEGCIPFKNDKFEIDTWFLKSNQNINRSEVKALLEADGISFQEKEQYPGNGILYFESGVYLDFDNRDGVWEDDNMIQNS